MDSIIDQSYKNIEIILVDDGSSDGCPAICDEYAEKDQRIKVLHKENGGLSDARNAGILESKGKYISFIDSDDYIDVNFIQVLFDWATRYNADISVCSYYRVYDDKLLAPAKRVDFAILTNIEAVRDVFTSPSLCEILSCNKLYKKELFTRNSIQFPVGKLYEDTFTTYKLLYYSHRVTFINRPLYHYTHREGSIMSSSFSKNIFDMVESSRSAAEWVKDNNLPLTQEVQSWQLYCAFAVLDAMIDSRAIDDDMWNDVSFWVLRNGNRLFRNRYISRKRKMLIFALGLGNIYPYHRVIPQFYRTPSPHSRFPGTACCDTHDRRALAYL